MTYRVFQALLLSAVAVVIGACGERPVGGAPATGQGGGAPGAAGRGEGRQTPTLVLAPTDIAEIAAGTVEQTTPVSGDLRPIEEIVVRSRVEGDVTAVRVREGESVRLGAVLATLDASELDAALAAAVADVAAARGDLATAEWNHAQSAELFKVGAISEQALKIAEQGALAARARLAASESRERTAQLARRDAAIVAPATGTIAARNVQTGERISRGAQLFTLVRDDTLEFTAAVPARSATQVAPGQDVRFAVDGIAFTGRVARVSPAIDPTSRSVSVFVRVPNRTRQLKANAFASGRVVSAAREGVLTIPVVAIRRARTDDVMFVYRIDGDVLATAPVQLGAVDDAKGIAEVREGLAAGDRVVVGNVGTIGRGMRVQILDGDRTEGRGRGGRGGRGGRSGRSGTSQ